MRLVLAHRVHADDVVEQAVEPGAAHRDAQHLRVAVGQDAGGDATGFQRAQHLVVLGVGAEVAVLVHQLVRLDIDFGISQRQTVTNRYRFDGVDERRAGQFPERAVVRAVVAGGDQTGVFDLLVAPEHTQRGPVPRKQLPGQQRDAVYVEQRAVGVEQHRARRSAVVTGRMGFVHAGTVFETSLSIACLEWC